MTSEETKITGEFVRLLTDHQTVLRSFVFSLMPNHPDARDLQQEINIVLWEKKDTFELGTNFRAWAFRVARNKVMNEQKRLGRLHWMVFDEDLSEALVDEDLQEDDSEELESQRLALRHCLSKLRSQDRGLLSARYTSKSEFERYALQAGRSRASLRVTLCRLRGVLRRCIEQRVAMGRRTP